MDNTQPIIVKRVKKVAAGHHGGAWKIAFADFATAMMAFFLVMWLMSSATPEQKRAISGYFQDPIGFTESASPHVIDLGGTPTPAPDRTLNDVVDPSVQQTDTAMDAEQAETFAEQLERENKRTIAIYPGRFQPMGRHHYETYKKIAEEYGINDTFIATSDKVKLPKSPLNFSEKENTFSKNYKKSF